MKIANSLGISLFFALLIGCTPSAEESVTSEELDSKVGDIQVDDQAVGDVDDSSLEVESIFTEPEETVLTQSLNGDNFFSLTLGLDPDVESDVQGPENGKVVCYDIEGLSKQEGKPTGESETTLEGEAELKLQVGQHYVIEVNFKNQGTLKALVGPDLIVQDKFGGLTLDVRLNQESTIAADLFLELSKEPSVLALFHSLDVKTSTIYQAAKEFNSKLPKSDSGKVKSQYWDAEQYQNELKKFAAALGDQVLTVAPYSDSFAKKKIKQIAQDMKLKADAKPVDIVLDPTKKTSCWIKQETCTKRPKKTGEFKDNHQNSSKDYVRCLKRSAEYHRWCENEPDQVTIAEFRQGDDVLASSDSQTPYEGCFISMDSCERHPKRIGQFIDTYKDASKNIDRCMMRAHDYFRSCRNGPDQVVVAKYYEKGVLVQSLDSNTPYSGCFVGISSCEKKPQWVGLRYDNHQNASSDKDRCLQRAHDFHRACGNDNNVKISAAFYKKGEVIQEIDNHTPYSGCFIQASVCRKNSDRVGLFIDNYRRASTDQERCMIRAHEIHRWCGNSFEEVVTSSFYANGEPLATSSSQVPYQGCFVSQSVCNKKPERIGLFLDNYQNSSADLDRCLMRAHDYHRSCQNKFDDIVTASFYKKGVLKESLDSQTPYSGCFIEIEQCRSHPEKEGLFIDNHKNSSYDSDRCMMRAADFHKWCKNDIESVVTASFYKKGDIKESIDSKTPYSGCYITLASCPRRPNKVGIFKDNYQNSSFDEDRCMERALDYRKWCRQDPNATSIASFYDKGQLLKQIISTDLDL